MIPNALIQAALTSGRLEFSESHKEFRLVTCVLGVKVTLASIDKETITVTSAAPAPIHAEPAQPQRPRLTVVK